MTTYRDDDDGDDDDGDDGDDDYDNSYEFMMIVTNHPAAKVASSFWPDALI